MRILASPAYENRRTNPYNAALSGAMERPGVVVREFSKKRLLLERWDIVHLHWPDGALDSGHAAGAACRVAYLAAKLLYAKACGAKIVWTIHNLRAHNGAHPRVESWLWRLFVPLVDAAISLSRSGLEMARERFPALSKKPRFVIPHGHYRGCYRNDCSRAGARARLGLPADKPVIGFVGQIKPYKNLPALLKAFLDNPKKDAASLVVAGRPANAALAAELTEIARGHKNVFLRFGHLAEDEMQLPLNACDLAVFPYREILNSGSAILALSFDRPVLVPAKGAMGELGELIGADWVMTYEGELTGEILTKALRWAVEIPRPAACDLAPLAWESIAEQTLAAYQSVARRSPLLSPKPATQSTHIMNALLRRFALLIIAAFLAMPVITLNGGVHLVLLIVCVFVLGPKMLEPGVWQFWLLGAYALLIGAFYVSGYDQWKEINSQQMRQVSMMLLVLCAMRGASLREMHTFFAGVLVVAAVGVVGEMRGVNMHDFLPAKVAEQDYYNDAAFLSGGEQRYRGFFTESSILLAATTGYGFLAILGAMVVRRRVHGGTFLGVTGAICAVMMLFLLGVTMAKTGLLLAMGGGAGFVFAVLRYAQTRRLPRLLGSAAAVVVVLAALFVALPGNKRAYFIDELRSLRPALEGDSKLEATSSGGMLTRVECWRIAIEAVHHHPLGVGLFGIGQVYEDNNHISLTGELTYLFGLEIYGLKNSVANVMAQTGVPGIVLLFAALWQCFIRPLRMASRRGEPPGAGVAGVYVAAFVMSWLFLLTCETYYWMAFPMVLKCYADAAMRETAAADAEKWEEEEEFQMMEAHAEHGELANA